MGHALEAFQEGLSLTDDQSPARIEILVELGQLYLLRLAQWGAAADRVVATDLFNQTLSGTSSNDPVQAKIYCGLGVAYAAKYNVGKLEMDLTLSIQFIEKAVHLTRNNDPERSSRLRILATHLSAQYEATKDDLTFERAVASLRAALELNDLNARDRAGTLSLLGLLYRKRYDENRELRDLDVSIEYHLDAYPTFQAQAEYDSRIPEAWNIGNCYMARFDHTGSREDSRKCISYHKEAVNASKDSPRLYFICAISMVYILCTHGGQWKEAYQLTLSMMTAFSHFLSYSMSPVDKLQNITHLHGWASSSASIALNAEQPPLAAIEAFETGRGLVLGSLMDLRQDVAELQEKHAEAASRWTQKCLSGCGIPWPALSSRLWATRTRRLGANGPGYAGS